MVGNSCYMPLIHTYSRSSLPKADSLLIDDSCKLVLAKCSMKDAEHFHESWAV